MAWIIKRATSNRYCGPRGWERSQRHAYRFDSLDSAKAKAAYLRESNGGVVVVRLKPKPAKGETYEAVGYFVRYHDGSHGTVLYRDYDAAHRQWSGRGDRPAYIVQAFASKEATR